MKQISTYIYENLFINESYSEESILKKIDDIEGLNKNIKITSNPKKIFAIRFNKSTGEVENEYEFTNDAKKYNNESDFDWSIWIEDKQLRYTFVTGKKYIKYDGSSCLIDNTKAGGIVIGYFEKENAQLIKDFVKNNLVLFDKKSDALSSEDIDILDKFFTSKVKNYEKILKNNTFAAYFPSRDEVKKLNNRVGMNNIPHITISKPSSYKGNFKVTTYKKGNWAATEWPDIRRFLDKDGNPLYSSVNNIISYLDHILKSNSDKLNAELK